MTEEQILDIAKEAMWVSIQMGTPIMLIGLIVGVIISLIQALTQIQEMTLSFVPKIIAIFIALFVFMPALSTVLVPYTRNLMAIVAGFGGGG